jgi:hypothetical protein
MNSKDASVSPEWVTPPPAGGDGRGGMQPRWLEANLPIPGIQRYCDSAKSIKELDCDPANIAEIFKDEISYRAQVRRLLWEFFD